MRRGPRRLFLVGGALAATAVAAGACGGGAKGLHGHGELTSGLWEWYDFARAGNDGCAFFNSIVGSVNSNSFAVLVTADTFTIDFSGDGSLAPTGPYAAGVFHGSVGVPLDWSQTTLALDCQELDTYSVDGATLSPGEAAGRFTLQFTQTGGTQCDQVYALLSSGAGQTIRLPCTSPFSFRMRKRFTWPDGPKPL